MSDLPSLVHVFGYAGHDGWCCDCCYSGGEECPEDYLDDEPDLFTVAINGTDYISDRYVAIRADHIETSHRVNMPTVGRALFDIPDTTPGPSTAAFNPERVHRLTHLGWSIREGNGQAHVYDGDQHIGFISPIVPRDTDVPPYGAVMRLADADLIDTIAQDVYQVPGYSARQMAAIVLNEARRMQREGLL